MSAVKEIAPRSADDTVTIEVNGQSIEARKGAMLIEVTDQMGVHVPRFCYHKKLSVAANCRMCLVEVEKAPKPLPACATPVMPGMKVHTASALALAAQKGTMEFLLINHPLDCPICDQGGECELQDVAMGYGESVSRYSEIKRVVPDKNIGPLISTEMTRCIHCTRCVRFGEEIAGIRELGATGRGEFMRIGTYVEHTVSHELSGNVIDLCPVGALTAKPSRFRARAWEYQQAPSVSTYDAVGTNLYAHLYQGRVIRVVPRENEAVNETWIADRDRYGYSGLYSSDRLQQPRIRENNVLRDATWEEALSRIAREVASVEPRQIGALFSPSLLTEEYFLATQVLRSIGVQDLDHRLYQQDFGNDAIAPLFPWLGNSIEGLQSLDAILLLGCNPRSEAPLLAHRLRKAALAGAKVVSIGSQYLDLTYPLATQFAGTTREQILLLTAVAKSLQEKGHTAPTGFSILFQATGSLQTERTVQAKAIAELLISGNSSQVLIGSSAIASPVYSTLQALAFWIAETTGSKIGYLPAGGNAIGAWLAGCVPMRRAGGSPLPDPGANAQQMLDQGREIFFLSGIEPDRDFLDPVQSRESLAKARFVVALTSHAGSDLEAIADVLLPVATAFESSGALVSVEGRWQAVRAVAQPPGSARPGWKIWRVLGNLLQVQGLDYLDVQGVREALKRSIPELNFDNTMDVHRASVTLPPKFDGLERLAVPGLYSMDATVRRSVPLQQTPAGQMTETLRVHPDVLESQSSGKLVHLEQNGHKATVRAEADNTVPIGVVLTFLGSSKVSTLPAPGSSVSVRLGS